MCSVILQMLYEKTICLNIGHQRKTGDVFSQHFNTTVHGCEEQGVALTEANCTHTGQDHDSLETREHDRHNGFFSKTTWVSRHQKS